MRRFAVVGLFLILFLSLGLSGCGGGSSKVVATPQVAKVTLSPASLSMEPGQVLQVSVLVEDASGKAIFTETPTFSSSNTSEVTVSTGGLVCAGTWDSLTAPVVCTPAVALGTSNLTAMAGGVTSNIVVASVHLHVDNITLSPASVNCKSQAGTQIFTATAFNGGTDITSTVGTFSWFSSNLNVAKVDVAGPATTPVLTANQASIKAVNPGQTNIAASIGGTNSLGALFVTCSPATISIHTTDTVPVTSFSIATSTTKQLAADVVDITGATITGLNLTWTSSQPAVASVSTAGLVTGVAPGTSLVTASCTPPNCNVGVGEAVYSNSVTATITGTATTTTVYATTTTAPASGAHVDLIPISTGTNTAGTAIAMPTDAVLNSLLIDAAGARAYVGSSKGLVQVDLGTNSIISTVTNVLGTALAVSPNTQFVVTSDTGGGKVYVYDAANSLVTALNIAGATHAAFTTDSLKAYIVAGGTLYQYSPSLTLRTIPMTAAANDVAVNSTGQFAYTAGGEAASIVDRATCLNDSTWAPAAGDIVGTGAVPDLIASASTGDLLAVEGGSSEMDKVTPTIGPPAGGTSCPPTLTGNALLTANFGVGAFTPRQLIVTPNGAKAYVTSDQTVLLGYDVAGNTTFSVAVGGVDTFTGGATIDSTKLYVGGSDNAVHVIDVATGTQSATVPLSFKPDLVAVRPH